MEMRLVWRGSPRKVGGVRVCIANEVMPNSIFFSILKEGIEGF